MSLDIQIKPAGLDSGYNPDVLTCLANLSNDEVFTPPNIANSMLDELPEELWSDPNAKFLDPVSKSGVFLREIAKRLMVGLESQIPDTQERINHIYTKQLYGIGITELTALLTRRSLYCSKYANGKYSIVTAFDSEDGNVDFTRIEHKWFNDHCVFCKASQDEYDRSEELETHAYKFIHTNKPEELYNMQFDVIIGNPPYQLNDGGGTGSSAIPLYDKFVTQAIKLNPRFLTMIIPSRWYAGGKGLDSFRDSMLKSQQITKIVDFANSADCFPGVTIAGGVNYFLWDRDYKGPALITNMSNNVIISEKSRPLDEYDVFVRNNVAVDIVRKIRQKNEKSLDSIVFSRNPFDLVSSESGHSSAKPNDLQLYSIKGSSFIDRSKVNDRYKIVDKYSVVMTKAMSGGNKPSKNGDYLVISATMKILHPGEVSTETYLVLGEFDNRDEATNLRQYMATKFFRYLLLQALTSINISKDKFQFIPLQDFHTNQTDEALYDKYDLNEVEIAEIETKIRKMELGI